jgi:hypothetical protein
LVAQRVALVVVVAALATALPVLAGLGRRRLGAVVAGWVLGLALVPVVEAVLPYFSFFPPGQALNPLLSPSV